MSDGRIGNSNQYLQIGGVVSAPAYSFASDNDSGMYRIGANNIGLGVNGAKVLDIATTGLGITGVTTGTSTSANALAVGRQGTTNPVLNVDASTSNVVTGLNLKGAAAAGGMALSVTSSGTNENLTIDAKGSGTITLNGTATGTVSVNTKLGIGMTPSNILDITQNQNAGSRVVLLNSNASGSASSAFCATNGDNNFELYCLGTGFTTTGCWQANKSLLVGSYDVIISYGAGGGSRNLLFANSTTEVARFDTSGNLLVGKTAIGSTGNGCQLQANGFIGSTLAGSTSATDTLNVYSTAASAFRFYVDMAGTIHATSTSISAISDQSLKTNVRPLETGLTEIMALQPRRFDWINGDAENVAGFIAQEVQQILPELVEEFKYDTSGETKLGLKMGDMIPTLVKAIQELTVRLEKLEVK